MEEFVVVNVNSNVVVVVNCESCSFLYCRWHFRVCRIPSRKQSFGHFDLLLHDERESAGYGMRRRDRIHIQHRPGQVLTDGAPVRAGQGIMDGGPLSGQVSTDGAPLSGQGR